MSQTLQYKINKKEKSQNHLELNDNPNKYNSSDFDIIERFDERLKQAIDEDRYLLDQESVAIMALKIGLCYIEESEKDAVKLRNQTWLETGKEEKLKQSLIDEMKAELGTYRLDELEKFTASEVLRLYQKLNECRE